LYQTLHDYIYVVPNFDTKKKALSSWKRLKKASNKGFRGQLLTSEALLLFMKLCVLPPWLTGNLPSSNG